MAKRIILSLLLALAGRPAAQAAAVFNGTDSDLSVVVSAAPPDYPILATCWFKATNSTSAGTLIALSDDGAGGSLDSLALVIHGDVGGDPIRAESTAAGASSQSSTSNGFTAGTWYFAAAYFASASSRQAVLSTKHTGNITWSTPETTTRDVGNLTDVSIGSMHDGGAGTRFAGEIAYVGIWENVDANLVDVAVRQLASGLQPNNSRSLILPSLVRYQQLWQNVGSSTNEGATVGSAMTAVGMSFNRQAPIVDWDIWQNADFRWSTSGANIGPVSFGRLVKLDTGFLALVDADDENCIGAIRAALTAKDYASGYQQIRALGEAPLQLEVTAGDSIDEGDIVYQAADGKIASSGTVRVGVALDTGTAGQVVRVSPSWTQ